MNRSRRDFIADLFGACLVRTPAILSVAPAPLGLAAPRSGSKSDSFRDAWQRELQGAEVIESAEVTLDAPAVAEDGAIVPLTLRSRIQRTDRLVLFVEKNPFPLIAAFQFAKRVVPFVSLRIKMNESSAVVLLARAGGRYYRTERRVRVVRGGCG